MDICSQDYLDPSTVAQIVTNTMHHVLSSDEEAPVDRPQTSKKKKTKNTKKDKKDDKKDKKFMKESKGTG